MPVASLNIQLHYIVLPVEKQRLSDFIITSLFSQISETNASKLRRIRYQNLIKKCFLDSIILVMSQTDLVYLNIFGNLDNHYVCSIKEVYLYSEPGYCFWVPVTI